MSANKARGTRWESAVRDYLSAAGFGEVRRVVQAGARDTGDLHLGDWALECKDHVSIDLASFVDQAEAEALNAGQPYGAAVIKRRRAHVGRGYVAMSLDTFARIAADLALARQVHSLVDALGLDMGTVPTAPTGKTGHPHTEEPDDRS